MGVSNEAIARRCHTSEWLVRFRLQKMSRWSLLQHAFLVQTLPVREALVYDGLENFSYSQYDPNNVNHAIGRESFFTYDFNFSPMNRKGRMSERQKTQKELLEKQFGKYPPSAIRKSTRDLFKRLHQKSIGDTLFLFSDNHFQYRRVVERDLKDLKIEHHKVSSKVYRNSKNKLFAVNHFDAQIRHNSGAFKRETIAFSKHSIAMMEKFVLFATYKNYLRPLFFKKHKKMPDSNKKSPAMMVGLTKKIFRFHEFFSERITYPQISLHKDWEDLFFRRDLFSRRSIAAYNGI